MFRYGVVPAGAGAAPVSCACPTTRSSRNCARCGPSLLTTASSASSHSRVSWGSTSTCDAIGAPDLLGARPLWLMRPCEARPRRADERRASPSPARGEPARSVSDDTWMWASSSTSTYPAITATGLLVRRSTPPTTLPFRLEASSLPSPVTTRSASASFSRSPDRVGDDVEAGAQRRAQCGETAGETARGTGARNVRDLERLQPRLREQRDLLGRGPFLRTENARRVDEARLHVAGADDFQR